jgi:SAM-dependent methyltransferase
MKPRRSVASIPGSSPLIRQLASSTVRGFAALANLPKYGHAWLQYQRLPGAERLRFRDAYPCLADRLPTSPYDPHYLQQAIWAAERIFTNNPPEHTDVGSQLIFAGMLAAKMPVTFVDIRPLELRIAQLQPIAGDLLALPFRDQSLVSVSSLHVVEHVGLGRYGDELNPSGTQRALRELQRVLAPGGSLFLSLPVGRPRVCFNAHRIHDPRDIERWLDEIQLVEFSAVDDQGELHLGASLAEATKLSYGCGLFWLRRSE